MQTTGKEPERTLSEVYPVSGVGLLSEHKVSHSIGRNRDNPPLRAAIEIFSFPRRILLHVLHFAVQTPIDSDSFLCRCVVIRNTATPESETRGHF